MPRPRKPYLHKQISRHGKVVWYFRREHHGARVRIPGDYDSPEFSAAYDAAYAGRLAKHKAGTDTGVKGTFKWLVEQHMKSGEWASFRPATRKQREAIFRRVIAKSPDLRFAAITRKDVIASRDAAKATPAQANVTLKVMRGLFQWAVDAGHMDENPARDVAFLKVEGDGFHTWSEEELDRFEAAFPLGTRERLAYAVLLYTGQRRGDVVRMGRQHIGKDGVLHVKQEKTGEELCLPILKPLRAALEAGPTGDLAFIVGANGLPMTKESFGNFFSDACRKAKVPGSAHGLRKAGATRAAEQGATHEDLKAIFGWTTSKMVDVYVRKADQRRLATAAMTKLEKNEAEPSYALTPVQGEGIAAKTARKSNV
jgi:integrase